MTDISIWFDNSNTNSVGIAMYQYLISKTTSLDYQITTLQRLKETVGVNKTRLTTMGLVCQTNRQLTREECGEYGLVWWNRRTVSQLRERLLLSV